jgi:hypothetical protein
MTTRHIRAVLVSAGMPPRAVEATPAAFWTTVGGIPECFARFALTRFGRRVAEVWCRDVACAAPNRSVIAPMFLYREFRGDISGPILITVGDKHRGETLSMTRAEVAKSIAFASRWPSLSQRELLTAREHLRACHVRRVRGRRGGRFKAP